MRACVLACVRVCLRACLSFIISCVCHYSNIVFDRTDDRILLKEVEMALE